MSTQIQHLRKSIAFMVTLIILLACSSTSNSSTPQETQVPTPLHIKINSLASLGNTCDDMMAKHQQVYAIGKITLPSHMSTCSGSYCQVDFTQNSETRGVWISTFGTANKMDELPDWFSAEDFKVYDSNGQLININDLEKVTFSLRMMPSKFYGTETVCSLVIKTIETNTGD